MNDFFKISELRAHLHLIASMNRYHWKHFCSFLIFPWKCSSQKSQYLFLHEFLNSNHLKVEVLFLRVKKVFILEPIRFPWKNYFSFLKHFQIYWCLIKCRPYLYLYSKISFYHTLTRAGCFINRNHSFLLNAIFLSIATNIFLKNC